MSYFSIYKEVIHFATSKLGKNFHSSTQWVNSSPGLNSAQYFNLCTSGAAGQIVLPILRNVILITPFLALSHYSPNTGVLIYWQAYSCTFWCRVTISSYKWLFGGAEVTILHSQYRYKVTYCIPVGIVTSLGLQGVTIVLLASCHHLHLCVVHQDLCFNS